MSVDNLLTATNCLNIKDNIINILLLGETGVGKSTFINSIVNYLTYNDFKKAENEKLITLIPLKCKIKDKHGKYHIIQIGPEDDQNECLEVGMSATQDVKSYVFSIWNGATKVRLIDTPGIGDVRGILQDYTNCENILSYIGQLHELHAICCLFKPTNSRITHFFDHCLSQILSRLDKSASKNLIFIFTNTRGSDYGPGDTLSSLQKIIDDMKARPPHVDISLKNKVFCFDNEAFRFLAATKENVQFDTYVKQRNCKSWKRSVKQCYNLIKYIVGDFQQPPLKPHFIKSTSAINEARRLILQLSQPLAEISQLISDNLYALQKHKDKLDLDSSTLDELRQKLYMPVIDLDVITLTLPVTVCASRKCAEIYKVGDNNKWHYKQRCHDPCFLKNVPKEIVGSPELVKCAAIDSSTSACMKCHCDFSTHMHVYYMTKTVDNRIVDQNVKQNIDRKEMLLQNARKLIIDISKRKDQLEKEHNVIVKTCAKFAHFLQNDAIIPFRDSYKDYIEYLIMREKSLGPLSQMSVIHNLQKLLQEYEEAKKSFSDALLLQKKIGEYDVLITPQKIQESIQELYKLKYNGKKIKELYECQKKSRNKEYKHSEYVHEVPCQLEEDKGKNQRRNPNEKAYHQNRQPNKAAYGHQIDNGEKNARDHSQSRYRGRDHSLPPPYSHLSHHPPDPRYQYHSRSYHPPQNHPALQYHSHINPWINHHPLNYPENQRPHSSLGHYNYRDPGPNSYDTGCYRTDIDVLNKNGRDSYELKVVLNRPQTESSSNVPHLPPPGQHFRSDFYPPRTSYSPHYENFSHYSGGHYDYYQNQVSGRPGQSQRPPQNRPNERGNSNRGCGDYRGRRGQSFPGFIKFLEYNYRDEQLAILGENVLNIFVEHEGTNGFMKEIQQNETSTVIRYHPSIPNLIAVGGENGCVTMWDTDKEEKLGCYQKHSSTVTGIGFSRNQKMMVTTGMDNKICVLDNSSSDCLFKMSIHQAVTSVDISPDDFYIAAGLEDGCICIYDIRDPLKYLICAQVHNSSVNKISFEKGPVAVESLHDGHSLTTINDSDFCDNRKAEIVNTECKNNNNFEDNLKKELFKMVKTQMNYLESQLAEHCTKFQSFINKEFDSIHNAMGRWDVFNVGDTNEIVQAIDTTDVKSTKSVSTRKSTTY